MMPSTPCHDSADIARIEVHQDMNDDGIVGPGDPLISTAQPAYDADDGERKFTLSLYAAKESSRYIIISYVMSSSAPVGKTYGFTVEKIKARGKDSGAIFELGGLPKNSSIKIIIALPPPPAPPCTGSISLALSPDWVAPNASVSAQMFAR